MHEQNEYFIKETATIKKNQTHTVAAEAMAVGWSGWPSLGQQGHGLPVCSATNLPACPLLLEWQWRGEKQLHIKHML